jgi:hypothetical protein
MSEYLHQILPAASRIWEAAEASRRRRGSAGAGRRMDSPRAYTRMVSSTCASLRADGLSGARAAPKQAPSAWGWRWRCTVVLLGCMPRTRSAKAVGIVGCAGRAKRGANLQELAKPPQVDGLRHACAHVGHRSRGFLSIGEFPPRRGARQGCRSVHVPCGESHDIR